ncbi:MAG: hypothetical protein PHI31_08975 [Desulfuromonadaceae bacterium]|nr:hypothetical protein [Desulfuromonadaceae bacterium]
MPEIAIDLKQALQIARAFNLAFNNAFMYGGSHQTTKNSAASFYSVLQPMLDIARIITISSDKDSIFFENHCVDKLVSVQRINSRFKKTGVQSVSFDRDASLESVLALFYIMGGLSDFQSVEEMQAYLNKERISGVKINYVVYKKVTIDDAIVNKDVLSETQFLLNNQHIIGSGTYMQADPGRILREVSEILSLNNPAHGDGASETGGTASPELSQSDYDKFITTQIRSLNNQLISTETSEGEAGLSPTEMLEAIFKIKENVLENIRLQKETGKLVSSGELAITEINQISYQVIVRLIKEEYRGDRKISVKRLAQIIRRMLPDIKELKYLLPQLKDGLFAEGMSPSEYLSLVKELSNELDCDGLIQIMVEASDQIGLSLNELIDSIKEAPEEAARLIVLAAEIKKGGITTDEQQMSAVLCDYIEKVSRALALQSPETTVSGGGKMLKAAVTRIEREIIGRLKSQNIGANTISDVAQKLADQFSETLLVLKGEWARKNVTGSKRLDEETVLSIIEQIAGQGHESDSLVGEIRTILISHGFSAEKIDSMVNEVRLRAEAAVTHKIEMPKGTYNASTMAFFLNLEIKRNNRYNSPFSTILVSYEKIVDLRTFTIIEVTPDREIQLTNQSLKLLKDMQRDLDVIGICTINDISVLLIVLPMTDVTGALYVKKRIEKDFPCHEFLVDGITVHIEPAITASSYNNKMTPDTASYLKSIYQLYTQPKLQ